MALSQVCPDGPDTSWNCLPSWRPRRQTGKRHRRNLSAFMDFIAVCNQKNGAIRCLVWWGPHTKFLEPPAEACRAWNWVVGFFLNCLHWVYMMFHRNKSLSKAFIQPATRRRKKDMPSRLDSWQDCPVGARLQSARSAKSKVSKGFDLLLLFQCYLMLFGGRPLLHPPHWRGSFSTSEFRTGCCPSSTLEICNSYPTSRHTIHHRPKEAETEVIWYPLAPCGTKWTLEAPKLPHTWPRPMDNSGKPQKLVRPVHIAMPEWAAKAATMWRALQSQSLTWSFWSLRCPIL